MVTVLLSFAVIPFAPGVVVADLNVGLLFFLAMSSLGVYSVVLGRLVVEQQVLAARRPARRGADDQLRGLHGPVAHGRGDAGRLVQPAATSSRRSSGLWFSSRSSSGFVVFLIAGLAETRRMPFDLPEAESELVAGYHTEYSGMKFGMFFVGEYLGITLISALIVDAVLRRLARARAAAASSGSCSRSLLFIASSSCCAASLPRPRYDQLMRFGWKCMLPLALLNLLVTGAVVLATA